MASSRPIAAGETYTPGDINNLRADVLDPTGGHRHDGADGARVPFANLDVTGAAGSTAPPGGSKSYNDMANHVASSQGAHGLNALAHVIGALTSGWLIQTGTISVNLVGSPNGVANGTVNFANTGVAFSGVPIVIPSHDATVGGYGGVSGVSIKNVTAAGFSWYAFVNTHCTMTNIMWLAIGPKA